MFWTCNHLIGFWQNIFHFISDNTCIFTSPDPGLAILNLGIDRFPPSCSSIATHILLAARLLIARGWRSDKVSNLWETVEIVHLHYKYETMLANKQGVRKIFHSQWTYQLKAS